MAMCMFHKNIRQFSGLFVIKTRAIRRKAHGLVTYKFKVYILIRTFIYELLLRRPHIIYVSMWKHIDVYTKDYVV